MPMLHKRMLASLFEVGRVILKGDEGFSRLGGFVVEEDLEFGALFVAFGWLREGGVRPLRRYLRS
jgi:hypothetical protein